MARRYRSYRKSNNAALEHVRMFNVLSRKLGPIVDDVQKAFFSLDDDQLFDLLSRYGEKHGHAAENYALGAMPKWKSGTTKMSGQTMERLLDFVPRYLKFEQKYEMLRCLCEHHREKKVELVRVSKDDPSKGLKDFDEALESFHQGSTFQHLPDHVMETLKWLNDADAVAARALLAKVEIAEVAQIKKTVTLNREIIHSLIADKALASFDERIEFPNGTLRVYSFKESFCIVATTVFEDDNHQTVNQLRDFREEILLTNTVGRKLTAYYYKIGPKLAKYIRGRSLLTSAIKLALTAFATTYWGITNGRK